ncbi:MAG: ATP-binding cassette domain-containing protein [Deltaproteobacteria bacterium]|nr:ATP-binding cassette domain-containing protein [Deltaproteobacteria bacterium]
MSSLRDGESVVVGADPAVDVVVDHPTVSGRHLRLSCAGGRYFAEDLGSRNGTRLDGFPIGHAEAVPDSVLELGSHRTTLRQLLAARGTAPAPRQGSGAPFGSPQTPAAAVVAPPRPADARPSRPVPLVAPAAASTAPSTPPALAPQPAPTHVRDLTVGASMVVFGREPRRSGTDAASPTYVQVGEPAVSDPHARAFVSAGRLIVEDLGSRNGTHVRGGDGNWTNVRYKPLLAGELVRIGSQAFRLHRADVAAAQVQPCRLDVVDLSRTVADLATGQPRTLLRAVSFTALPGELVGIMGPSGSGKTTLLDVLAGFDAPSAGQVLVQGQALFGAAGHCDPSIAGLLGHAPQFDVTHAGLTAHEAVAYAAQLRGPSHWSATEISDRAQRALDAVDMGSFGGVRMGGDGTKTLSGGQKKRVNIAMELVLDPPVLLLDEPTSGLSATDTKDLMLLLRRLADAGRTVLLTIHQPSYQAYVAMDQVLVLEEGGHLAYFGPTAIDSFGFFRTPDRDPAALLEDLPRKKDRSQPGAYATAYHGHPLRHAFVDGRAASLGTPAPPAPATQGGVIRQFATLLQRALTLKIRDQFFLLLTTAVPVAVAALFAAVLGARVQGGGWTPAKSEVEHAYLVILTVMACLFGALCAALEVVSEQAILRRERRGGLSLWAYVGSKAALYAIPALAFPLLAVGTVLALGQGALNGGLVDYVVVLAPAFFAAACAGLCASAAVRSAEGVIVVAVFYAIVQVVFAVFVPLHVTYGGNARSGWLQAAAAPMTARWALQGLVSHHDLCRVGEPSAATASPAAAGEQLLALQALPECERRYYHDHGVHPSASAAERTAADHRGRSLAVNGGLAGLALAATLLALRRRLG